MKTIQAITAMMLAYLALTACNKEEFPPNRTTPDGNGNAIRITATMGDFTGNSPDTRATIDEHPAQGASRRATRSLSTPRPMRKPATSSAPPPSTARHGNATLPYNGATCPKTRATKVMNSPGIIPC